MLKNVCEELGVEVGEIWKANDGNEYCILDNGSIHGYVDGIFDAELNDPWADILMGNIKPIWRPVVGEIYYTTRPIARKEEYMYLRLVWYDEPIDRIRLDCGLVFSTQEEAMEKSKKILEFIKGDR